jgi:hypothetical protein
MLSYKAWVKRPLGPIMEGSAAQVLEASFAGLPNDSRECLQRMNIYDWSKLLHFKYILKKNVNVEKLSVYVLTLSYGTLVGLLLASWNELAQADRFFETIPLAQWYKTFYSRNLGIFVIS